MVKNNKKKKSSNIFITSLLYNKAVFELSINFHVHKTVSGFKEKKFLQFIIGLCLISIHNYFPIDGKKLIVDFCGIEEAQRRLKNNERIDF